MPTRAKFNVNLKKHNKLVRFFVGIATRKLGKPRKTRASQGFTYLSEKRPFLTTL
jgi:hypothetical protein